MQPTICFLITCHLDLANLTKYYEQFPPQVHRAMHGRTLLKHLQIVLQPILHLLCTRFWQEAATSGSIVHRGSHSWSFLLMHPKTAGLGKTGFGFKAFPHINAPWYIALFVCCNKAAAVGGIFSICSPFEQKDAALLRQEFQNCSFCRTSQLQIFIWLAWILQNERPVQDPPSLQRHMLAHHKPSMYPMLTSYRFHEMLRPCHSLWRRETRAILMIFQNQVSLQYNEPLCIWNVCPYQTQSKFQMLVAIQISDAGTV